MGSEAATSRGSSGSFELFALQHLTGLHIVVLYMGESECKLCEKYQAMSQRSLAVCVVVSSSFVYLAGGFHDKVPLERMGHERQQQSSRETSNSEGERHVGEREERP